MTSCLFFLRVKSARSCRVEVEAGVEQTDREKSTTLHSVCTFRLGRFDLSLTGFCRTICCSERDNIVTASASNRRHGIIIVADMRSPPQVATHV